MRIEVLACCVFLLPLIACGGSDGGARSDPRVVTGTVTAVAEDGAGVRSFRLRAVGGRGYEIAIARDVDYGFDLTHLHEHQATRDPVVVRLERRDGRLVAISIEDA